MIVISPQVILDNYHFMPIMVIRLHPIYIFNNNDGVCNMTRNKIGYNNAYSSPEGAHAIHPPVAARDAGAKAHRAGPAMDFD